MSSTETLAVLVTARSIGRGPVRLMLLLQPPVASTAPVERSRSSTWLLAPVTAALKKPLSTQTVWPVGRLRIEICTLVAVDVAGEAVEPQVVPVTTKPVGSASTTLTARGAPTLLIVIW